MLGRLDEECAPELDRNVTCTWKVAEVLAVTERHERAHQARASRRNLEKVVHATNYYPSGNAHRQTAPARQSDGVPFDYARFQPPPQRQAVMCACFSGPHPADTCRFRYAICNYCLQEFHIERACELKQRALAFRLSRKPAEPADGFDIPAPQNRPVNSNWRGGRKRQNSRGRRSGQGGP